MLYLYFASNADGFQLALSPAAIRQTIGMPPQTYRDQFLKLVDRGYLVHKSGNRYEFFEIPQEHATQQKPQAVLNFENDISVVHTTSAVVQNETENNIEINIDKIDNNKYPMEKQVSPSQEFTF